MNYESNVVMSDLERKSNKSQDSSSSEAKVLNDGKEGSKLKRFLKTTIPNLASAEKEEAKVVGRTLGKLYDVERKEAKVLKINLCDLKKGDNRKEVLKTTVKDLGSARKEEAGAIKPGVKNLVELEKREFREMKPVVVDLKYVEKEKRKELKSRVKGLRD